MKQLHLIPDDDGHPHAPSTECGCGVRLTAVDARLVVVEHTDMDEGASWDDVRAMLSAVAVGAG